jgi:hypothetical protein
MGRRWGGWGGAEADGAADHNPLTAPPSLSPQGKAIQRSADVRVYAGAAACYILALDELKVKGAVSSQT